MSLSVIGLLVGAFNLAALAPAAAQAETTAAASQPLDTSIIKVAPLEIYGTDGTMTGVTQSVVGQHYNFVRIDGEKAVLADSKGNIFMVQSEAVTIPSTYKPSQSVSATTPAPSAPAAPLPQSTPALQKAKIPPTDTTGQLSNYVLTVEMYKISPEDGASLLEANETGQARHDAVTKSVHEGKATLDALLCGVTKTAAQAVTEQMEVVCYADTFGVSGGMPVAKTYRRRSVGDRLVFKLTANPNGQGCTVTMFLEGTCLSRFSDHKFNDANGSYTAELPEFTATRVNSAPAVFPYDKIQFIGTYNTFTDSGSSQAPSDGQSMCLVFGRVSQIQLDPGTIANRKPTHLEQQLSVFSMERDKALEILTQEQDVDSAYQAVQALVESHAAKLEHLSILKSSVGIKCSSDEASEGGYPADGANSPAPDLGYSGEMRPDVDGQQPLLTINVTKSQLLDYAGKLHTNDEAASYDGSQPILELHSLNTTINSALGEHELLGTFSPAGSTAIAGQGGSDRVWLEFLKTTADGF